MSDCHLALLGACDPSTGLVSSLPKAIGCVGPDHDGQTLMPQLDAALLQEGDGVCAVRRLRWLSC
jgi:hypothetical protein